MISQQRNKKKSNPYTKIVISVLSIEFYNSRVVGSTFMIFKNPLEWCPVQSTGFASYRLILCWLCIKTPPAFGTAFEIFIPRQPG
jgi:hypothetical protein